MKNMGLRRLTVVAPRALDIDRARWMAPGATEILDGARWTGSVAEAVESCTFVAATTARGRHHAWPSLAPDGLARRAFDEAGEVAVLFGPEDAGLDNDDLSHAHALVHIPTDAHASINVAQAVLLVAASLFGEATSRGYVPRPEGEGRRGGPARGAPPGPSAERPIVPAGALEPMLEDWLAALAETGYLRTHDPLLVAGTLRRILQRAALDGQEVAVLRGMMKKLRLRALHGGTPREGSDPSGGPDAP
jgi:TrmH family RNA methyltransferase